MSLFKNANRRHGLTIIELVASLAIFVIIMTILYAILNSATEVWSASSNGRREREQAYRVLRIIGRDLEQAITDHGIPTNKSFRVKEDNASFVMDLSLTNSKLPFLRFAIPAKRSNDREDDDLSLDAVFYTYSDESNAIYRTVNPLPAPEGQTLGELLEKEEKQQDGETTCLMRHVFITRLSGLIHPAALIDAHSDKDPFGIKEEHHGGETIYRLEGTNDVIYANSLPNSVLIELSIIPEDKWEKWKGLIGSKDDQDQKAAQSMEIHASREIRIRTAGASRLP